MWRLITFCMLLELLAAHALAQDVFSKPVDPITGISRRKISVTEAKTRLQAAKQKITNDRKQLMQKRTVLGPLTYDRLLKKLNDHEQMINLKEREVSELAAEQEAERKIRSENGKHFYDAQSEFYHVIEANDLDFSFN